MKALILIPKKIKKDYLIRRYEDHVAVNSPTYININFDNGFEITNGKITVDIKNNKCIVYLWKKVFNMHVTIYK